MGGRVPTAVGCRCAPSWSSRSHTTRWKAVWGERGSQAGVRFRHAARFLRWRPDRDPQSCTFEQLEVPLRYDLADVLTGES